MVEDKRIKYRLKYLSGSLNYKMESMAYRIKLNKQKNEK